MSGFGDTIKNLYIHYGYFAVIIAMLLESMGIPLPSEIILPLAGFMVALGYFNMVGAIIAGLLGGLIGSLIAFYIGKKGGIPLINKYGKYLLIRKTDIVKADEAFQKHGDIIVSVSRIMPIIRTYISFPAGFSGMKVSKFILYTLIGSLPWTIALVYIGKSLGNNWDKVGNYISKYQDLVIVILVILIITYLYTHIKSTNDDNS